MYEWPKMVDLLPEQEVGEVKISHFEIDQHGAAMESMRGCITRPGKFCRLTVGGILMMSDTLNERRTCSGVVWNANGRVLVAGLGMGWILHPILSKPEVTEVVVIEKSADVIKAVSPSLAKYGDRLKIICADIFEWRPAKGEKFDTIWFDIWPDVSTDDLKEMARLNRAFARNLNRENPKAWRAAWSEDMLKYRRSQESRSGYGW
jgi:predicted membrane-bound spermidine synthase